MLGVGGRLTVNPSGFAEESPPSLWTGEPRKW